MRSGLIIAMLVSGLASAAEPELHVPFERYRLPNGMTVILHEDHKLPQVVVDIWFKVGSKDEKVKRTGFAHLFEHLMFMGTNKVPNGAFDRIMEGSGGTNNASTSEDMTNYFENGPSNLLETFLWLESDRLQTLADGMTRQKVDLQREVVKNERRQSIENRPYGKVELVMPEHMYPEDHPYHHPVIGSHADLTAASVDDVKQFFRSYYLPSNASLVIAGDFKRDEAKKLVDKYFAWMPRTEEPAHMAALPVALTKSDKVVVKDNVKLEQVTLSWHSPQLLQPGDASCELLAALLGTGKSSRLQKTLIYDKKLASEVRVDQRSNKFGGNFVITVTAAPGHNAEELIAAVDEELTALDGARPPTEREVERARAFVQTENLRGLERLFGVADMLNQFEFLTGDPGELQRNVLARYAHLDASDLRWQSHALFSKPRLTIVVQPGTTAPSAPSKKTAMAEGNHAQ
jgi:zinc protease